MTEHRADADQPDADEPDADQPAAAQHDAATLAAALDDDAAQLRLDSVTLQAFIRSLLPADAVTRSTGAPGTTALAIAFDSTGATAVVAATSLRLRATDARIATLRRLTRKA